LKIFSKATKYAMFVWYLLLDVKVFLIIYFIGEIIKYELSYSISASNKAWKDGGTHWRCKGLCLRCGKKFQKLEILRKRPDHKRKRDYLRLESYLFSSINNSIP